MNHDDLVLIDRWLDGELLPDERQALHRRLQDDPQFAADFAQETRLQGLMSSLLAPQDGGTSVLARVEAIIANSSGSGPQRMVEAVEHRLRQNRTTALRVIEPGRRRVARPSRRLRARPQRILPMVLVLGAMAAVLAVAILVWQRAPAPPGTERVPAGPAPATATVAVELARLAAGSSKAICIRAGGAGVRLPAPPGTVLEAGDGILVEAGGSAVLAYADGTRLVADPGTALTLSQAGGAKRIALTSGALTAHVAPQPAGLALVVTTPQARAEIVGTIFTLAVTADASRLAVSEGRIAFAALAAPAQPLLVAAGGSAVVENGVVQAEFGAAPLWQEADALRQVIPATAAESAWQQVPWLTSIAQARAQARRLGRPLLVWVGWGHPLGLCAPDTLTARMGCLEDPQLLALISAQCVPLAIDAWFVRQRTDADSRWLFQTVARTDLSVRTRQGLVVMDADGRLLGDSTGDRSGAEVRAKLEPAIAAGQTAAAPVPAPAPAPPAHPPGMLIASIEARRLVHAQGLWTAYQGATPPFPAPGRDALWLTREEWRGFLPTAPTPGLVSPAPRALVLKLARFVLLDSTLGEASTWSEAAVTRADLRIRVTSVTAAAWDLELEGHTTCGEDGRGYDAEVIGRLRYRPGTQDLERFELLALGDHWGDAPFGERAPPGHQPLGVLIRLDARDQALELQPYAAVRADGYFPAP